MLKYYKYLPAALVTILTIRVTIFGASVGEALSILALAGLFGYRQFLDTKAIIDPNKELKEELDKVKDQISAISVAQIQKPKPSASATTYKF